MSIHVTPKGDGWQVKKGGASRATKLFDTQAEAIAHGRQNAINQKTELNIHGRNGQIRDKNSYGNDPFPPRG